MIIQAHLFSIFTRPICISLNLFVRSKFNKLQIIRFRVLRFKPDIAVHVKNILVLTSYTTQETC